MSQFKVDQLEVCRHFKMTSKLGKVEAHSSNNTLGLWVGNNTSCATMYVTEREGVVLAFYPDQKIPWPFSVSRFGVQLPAITPNQKPISLSWERLRQLASEAILNDNSEAEDF